MILNTGSRTDIPAYYSEWFMNRIRAGFVLVRNPYYPSTVYRYRLTPDVVDILSFCTKNPEPMLKYMDELKKFRQFWYVTITPYGTEIEPNVPSKKLVMQSFRRLSDAVGVNHTGWRYDPIFIHEKYTVDYHIRTFEKMAAYLQGYTKIVVISFIDLYQKTVRNFPEIREVSWHDQVRITEAFVRIAEKYGMQIYTCMENEKLAAYGADTGGCYSEELLEKALDLDLQVPRITMARKGCRCLLGADIGEYNTCAHFCRYCYANYDRELVIENRRKHDPASPLLVGNLKEDDRIQDAVQETYINRQLALEL